MCFLRTVLTISNLHVLQAVILIYRHDNYGTAGLLLNRPAQIHVGPQPGEDSGERLTSSEIFKTDMLQFVSDACDCGKRLLGHNEADLHFSGLPPILKPRCFLPGCR